MADAEELAGLLTAARKGDHDAFQKAQEQLAPFVHSLVSARTPNHLAGSVVRHVMVQGAIKLDQFDEPRAFVRELFAIARKMADEAPGEEDVATDPLVADGRRLLAKFRTLPITLRERLIMRLLEGLTGGEIAELLEVNADEVRASLDQALCEHLGQPPGTFRGDGYLWSLVGAPPPALVSLENQLTPLRFDLALLDSGDDGTTDVSEVTSPSGKKKVKVKDGQRPTGSQPAASSSNSSGALRGAPPSGASSSGLKAPSATGSSSALRAAAPSAGSSSSLRPPPPSAGSSSSLRPPPPSAGSAPKSASSSGLARPPSADPRAPSGLTGTYVRGNEPETTDASGVPLGVRTDATAVELKPVQAAPPMTAPPGQGSSGTVVKTIPASDLPAAAAFDLNLPPPPVAVQTRDAPPVSEPEPSNLNPLPPVWPSRARHGDEDDDATQVKPTRAPGPPVAERDPEVTKPPTQWKASKLLGAPDENDAGATRAILPPVAPMAPPGSLLSSYRPFVIAGAFAAVAIGVVLLTLNGVENRVKSGWNLVPVVVAAADLPEGTQVTLDLVSQRAVPEQFVTSSVVRPDSTDYVLNQRLLVPVQAGDPLLWTQFESAHVNEHLSRKVQKRARAMAVHAPASVAVGGWVQPNDHVDVVATVKDPKAGRVSVTLMENLVVLSAGKVTGTSLGTSKEKSYQDVTLLLLPEEAEILTLASRLASIKFTLRSDESDVTDVMAHDRWRTEMTTLLDGQRVRVLQNRRLQLIHTIRNSKRKL